MLGQYTRVLAKHKVFFAGLPVILSLLVTVPWLIAPCAIGDHEIHALAAQQWCKAWNEGTLWPAYFDDVNAGLGSWWPSYYPPLYHLLCAAGLSLGMPYWQAAGTCMLFAHALGTILCYAWLRLHFCRKVAVCGAFAYALAPFTFFTLDHRGAFPEALAFEWFPGVLWACDRLSSGWNWRPAVLGSGCFALIVLSNLPALVVAAYGITIYIVVKSLLTGESRGALRAFAVPMLGGLLTAFFWLPLWLERDSVAFPSSDLAAARGNQQYFSLTELRTQNGSPYLDRNLLFLGLCFQLLVVVRVWAASPSRWALFGSAVALTAAGIWLSTDTATFAYRSLPFLSYIQFPWRALELTSCGLALLAADAIGAQGRRTVTATALVSMAAYGTFFLLQRQDPLPVAASPAKDNPARALYDYIPKLCQPPLIGQEDLPKVDVLTGKVRWRVERWGCHRRVIATQSEGPFGLLVRTYAHFRWKAYDQDGHRLSSERCVDDMWGRMLVAGGSQTRTIELVLETSQAVVLGAAISIASLLLLAAFLLPYWSRPRARLSPAKRPESPGCEPASAPDLSRGGAYGTRVVHSYPRIQ
jgi:hypothetical protein